MKCNFLLTVVAFCVLSACQKNNATATTPLNEMVDTVSVSVVTGEFIKGPYGTTTGTASVYMQNGKHMLALENVNISNGPDLHVYLSKEVQPINFIDLGKLKSVSGNQLYEITGKPDFAAYKYALIHCQQYNHLFGSALLK